VPLTCLVTIHGIGFQQPPSKGTPGYADDLHAHLAAALGARLGDDPERSRIQPGQAGAVYVESVWPGAQALPTIENGLKRLGSWDPANPGHLQASPPPLVEPRSAASIAHVALVYSHLELTKPQPGASLEAIAQTALNLVHYEPIHTLTHSLLLDVKALFRHPPAGSGLPVSLRPRTDTTPPSQSPQAAGAGPSGVHGTIVQLENDVAAYVAQNALRVRVRAFIMEALLRLVARGDIDTFVVNAHSQGTVASFDVLRNLPDSARADITWRLVTAGSPLRKYRDLFAWGDEVGAIHALQGWTNYYDDSDPVADPLQFPNPAENVVDGTLFRWVDPDTGTQSNQVVDDVKVDNLTNCVSPGGLQAHNYWDNLPEFIRPLAKLLGGDE
jgi:hypothetical protein